MLDRPHLDSGAVVCPCLVWLDWSLYATDLVSIVYWAGHGRAADCPAEGRAHGAVAGDTGDAGSGIQLRDTHRHIQRTAFQQVAQSVHIIHRYALTRKQGSTHLAGFVGRGCGQEAALGGRLDRRPVQHVLLRLFALLQVLFCIKTTWSTVGRCPWSYISFWLCS